MTSPRSKLEVGVVGLTGEDSVRGRRSPTPGAAMDARSPAEAEVCILEGLRGGVDGGGASCVLCVRVDNGDTNKVSHTLFYQAQQRVRCGQRLSLPLEHSHKTQNTVPATVTDIHPDGRDEIPEKVT
jgi:hypothetical protein